MITKTVTMYVTNDGKEFFDKEEAQKHETFYKQSIELRQKAKDIRDYCAKFCTGNSFHICQARSCPFFSTREDYSSCVLIFDETIGYDKSELVFPKDWVV